MKRTIGTLAIVATLIGVAVVSEVRLGAIPRPDPLGRELLYLPSPEILKILSLGNPGLAADVLYLWSIQYYSFFEPHERFLYLETIFNLITDLDPLYADAYRIGALIMQIQTGGDQGELKKTVARIFDKGIRNLPENWQLAEAAAWDFFIRFKDRKTATHYAAIAARMPDAPPRIKRMVGVWRDEDSAWTVEDSIDYWRRALEDAEDEWDRVMCMGQLYDAIVARDRHTLEPLLREFRSRHGFCPREWDDLIRAGALGQTPVDLFGDPYGIGSENCELVAYKRIKDQ
ncbi:MAG: hypothetical protein P8127_00650 [Acidobacteriota bacterium]